MRERGFACDFVCDPSLAGFVEQEGFRRIPRGSSDGSSFAVARWARPLDIALQVKHVEFALEQFQPDVLVTNVLGLGPMIVAERRSLPLAVIGLASYLYPDALGTAHAGKLWNERETLGFFNAARRALGLADREIGNGPHPLLGDAFLVRAAAEVYEGVALPEAVRFVGALLWEPAAALDGEIEQMIRAARAAGKRILYVQPGRVFGRVGGWRNVVAALGQLEVLAVVGLGRCEETLADIPPNVIVREHVPQARLLPFVDGVITVGHTTPVLGAIAEGIPLLLIPDGSGTFDTAEICSQLRIAAVADSERVAEDLAYTRERIASFLTADELRTAAARAAELYRGYSGTQLAADAIAHLAAGAGRRRATRELVYR